MRRSETENLGGSSCGSTAYPPNHLCKSVGGKPPLQTPLLRTMAGRQRTGSFADVVPSSSEEEEAALLSLFDVREPAAGDATSDPAASLAPPGALSADKHAQVAALLERVGNDFVRSDIVSTRSSEADISGRFTDFAMGEDMGDESRYFSRLVERVVADSIHTSCPTMIGHMTSALPYYFRPLANLVVSMNQNVVKTETAKTVTFLEREALAKLHSLVYGREDAFYKDHVQNAGTMLGTLTSGGTTANLCALWLARNHRLGPDDGDQPDGASDGAAASAAAGGDAGGAGGAGGAASSFAGVEKEGIMRALRHYGDSDMVVIGSALMHYSLNKATDLLGLGTNNIIKVPTDDDYRVDLELLEAEIVKAKEAKVFICALVGICGATETGAIDPLREMAALARKYDVHFHVDAAWGGPMIFSPSEKYKAAGIEGADTVTLDGHKQLWLPMGTGMVFMKDPYLIRSIRKSAKYIIRKESFDLGKFTLQGSRPATALYLHANLEILGRRGFQLLSIGELDYWHHPGSSVTAAAAGATSSAVPRRARGSRTNRRVTRSFANGEIRSQQGSSKMTSAAHTSSTVAKGMRPDSMMYTHTPRPHRSTLLS